METVTLTCSEPARVVQYWDVSTEISGNCQTISKKWFQYTNWNGRSCVIACHSHVVWIDQVVYQAPFTTIRRTLAPCRVGFQGCKMCHLRAEIWDLRSSAHHYVIASECSLWRAIVVLEGMIIG